MDRMNDTTGALRRLYICVASLATIGPLRFPSPAAHRIAIPSELSGVSSTRPYWGHL